jgi:hypothetical protein
MEKMVDQSTDALVNSVLAYGAKLNGYCQLALKQEPSEEEADRLAAIYTDAENDPLFNFLITELDQILAERLKLLDIKTVQKHEDQQAWLREHLEQSLFDRKHRLEIQKLLHEQGFYNGALDGILGQHSYKAFTEFRKALQKGLRKQGLYSGAIDGELGEQSVKAVRKFQRSRRLKEDGVPGRKTFFTLQSS